MKAVEMTTTESKVPLDPKKTKLPILLLADRAMIKWHQPSKELGESGLIKPGNIKEDFSKGEIYSLGMGTVVNPLLPEMCVGLIVNYYHQQAIDYIIDKETYHLVRFSDIFAVV